MSPMLEPTAFPLTPTTALLSHFRHAYGVWLRMTGELRQPARAIISGVRRAGMTLDVYALNYLPRIPFWRYDLIVLEAAPSAQLAGLIKAVKRARFLSGAPIIVLAPTVEQDMVVAALRAGADAVSPIETSKSVLLAHWDALLRRREASQNAPLRGM
ncbi:MAG: hypothetical protein BroJett021_00610 [Chloroflexota bacterium]|nr:MAG: hypothetical protein BroJett021_00610 [Chloroflexota bacterium]